jgi:hypothetical protein
VRALGDSASARARTADDALLPAAGPAPVTALVVAVGLRVETLREILSSAASHYLDDVRLHLRLDVVVRAGDEVRVRVGPANVTPAAGTWPSPCSASMPLLRAGAIDVVAGDSNRLDLVPCPCA